MSRVLIAGGGPVGLFSALLLARRGVAVRLFDENPGPQPDPRAATTHPATLEIMAEAGLVPDMERVGLIAPLVQFWDRVSGVRIAEFDHGMLARDTRFPYVVQCEQFKTARIVLDRLEAMPQVEILWGHRVTDAAAGETDVSVTVAGPRGEETHRGDWLIGADGGRSQVRKACSIAFEGFTWPERFIVLSTPHDFSARGYCSRNYFADPEEWCNCFHITHDGPPGLWRTVFPAAPERSEAELLSDASVEARLQRFFPAPQRYEIVHRNLYVTHQRVAARFHQGRVLLAGDAAHVNNPIGGMGLNGGLQDAANLAPKLADVIAGGDPRLLDLYEKQRRTVALEFVQEQTIANKKRLEEKDPEARARNLDELRRISEDPARARQFLLRSAMLTSQRRAAAIALQDL
jgi:3-(3-hydroxy-phenyl)propionate hydroxylase